LKIILLPEAGLFKNIKKVGYLLLNYHLNRVIDDNFAVQAGEPGVGNHKLNGKTYVNLVNIAGENTNQNATGYDEIPSLKNLSVSRRTGQKPDRIIMQPEGHEMKVDFVDGVSKVVKCFLLLSGRKYCQQVIDGICPYSIVGNLNAAISWALRTNKMLPANAGRFHVLPFIAWNLDNSINLSGEAETSATSPFSVRTSIMS
jgi:hypothetical protein